MGKFILGLITVAVLASMIMGSLQGRSADRAESIAAPAAPVRVVTGPERDEIVSRVTKGLVLERDKMEKVSFYSAKARNLTASRVESYIALRDSGLPILRMKTAYFGDDWIFYDSVKIMVDDSVIYGRDFRRTDIDRDNSSGKVWEVVDYVANDLELAALAAISKSKSATIRFSGDKRRHDHEITKKERAQIRQVLETYAKLTSQLSGEGPAVVASGSL